MSNAKRRHRRARRALFARIALRAACIAAAEHIIRATHKCPFSMDAHAEAWKLKREAEAWLR